MPGAVGTLQQLAHEDQHRTIQDLTGEIRNGHVTCQQILTVGLGMHYVTIKFVPRILTADQKQQCINICEELDCR
jgi:hypothetical protein